MGKRVLLLEPIGGIAGDMFLAAAIDVGVSLEALNGALQTLNIPGWEIRTASAQRHAISGIKLDVVMTAYPQGEVHGHRSWVDIAGLITRSGLGERPKALALRIFRALAEAEGRIHDVPPDEVEFHEVGSIDAIVDICGAAVALDLMGNPVVYAAPPPMGSGTTMGAHGAIPIPAPATLELLRNVPVRFVGEGELTTPTGAAILKTIATIGSFPEVTIERIGYGVGTRDWADRPNVLRASLGTMLGEGEHLVLLECNLDDCSPQILGAVVEMAMARGGLDAWIVPIVMKKGRPGHQLSILASEERRQSLLELLVEETTTLGIRESAVERTALKRHFEALDTPWGAVRIKIGEWKGRIVTAMPEFEDCRAIAAGAKVSIKDVHAAALAAWHQRSRR